MNRREKNKVGRVREEVMESSGPMKTEDICPFLDKRRYGNHCPTGRSLH